MTSARLLIALAAAAVALAGPATAAANPPAGDWTLVRKDAFKHYACKKKADGDRWRVKTATWWNHDREALDAGIGAYVALARGGNKKLVSTRSSDAWEGGYVRTVLRGAGASDRLWMQGAYYGPAEPWSDGLAVERLKRCASVA